MDYIRNFHSLPSLYIFIFFALGVAIAWFAGDLFSLTWLIIIYILLFVLLVFVYNKSLFFTVSLLCFVFAGLIRMWLALYVVSPAENNMFQENYDSFQGTITDADYRNSKANVYILRCEKIITDNEVLPADGLVVINQGRYDKDFNYGDVIRIQGKARFPALPTNPGEFNYRRYLQLNDQFFYMRLDKDSQVIKIFSDRGNMLQVFIFNPLRNIICNAIDTHLSGHAPAIAKALILGQRGTLDKSVISDFQKTGVIHVLAISGLHVGFIALMLQFVLTILRIPQKIAMSIIILFLVLFVALVNFKAPVVRASLMMSFYYISKFSIRPQKALNVIALAGLIILIVKPEQLLLPGFQYSFAAVFGLIYGSDKLNTLLPYVRLGKKISVFFNKNVRTPFVASLSAIIATLPLTWFYFGSIQIGAVLANIFIIPYIALVLFLVILFVSFSWLAFFPLKGIALLIDYLIEWMIQIVSRFAALPYIQIITGHPALWHFILIIIAVFLFFNVKYAKARIGLTAIFAFLLLSGWFGNAHTFKITFINVGQGDASLLQFPNNNVALVDAGNKGFAFDAGQRYVDPVLKYYGISEVNYLIASHPHGDHIGGFEFIINNYIVDTLVINAFPMKSKLYQRILKLAKQKRIFIKVVDRGDIIYADSQTRLYILHPGHQFLQNHHMSGEVVNNSSLVLKIVHGKNSFLLNGDAEFAAEQSLVKYTSFLNCDILKVAHHGSNTSSSDLFLDWAQPGRAVISVAKKNKFNHPSPETLLKYANRKIPVLRTDISGAVVFESDGKSLKRVNWR